MRLSSLFVYNIFYKTHFSISARSLHSCVVSDCFFFNGKSTHNHNLMYNFVNVTFTASANIGRCETELMHPLHNCITLWTTFIKMLNTFAIVKY